MNTLVLLVVIFFISFGGAFAQNIPGVANGAANKDSRDDFDNGIRLRSIELERVKSEHYRLINSEKSAASRKMNYSQIKKDFEAVQKLQNAIVKTYVTGEQINYGRIGEFAARLNDCAKRLEENLLLSVERDVKDLPKNRSNPEDIPDIIVLLDKSVGKFITSSVFKNLNIIEPKDAEKAEFDLQNIIRLSGVLAVKAEKQK